MNYTYGTSLVLKNTANIIMNNSIQVSIKLLQLSAIELENYIAQKLETNPLLMEEEFDVEDKLAISESDGENVYKEAHDRFNDIIENESHSYDNGSIIAKYNNYSEYAIHSETFHEHLIKQIYTTITDDKIKLIALRLVDYIDNDGYIDCNFLDLSNEIYCNVEEIEQTLLLLQTFEPIGIFARNLAECFRIQLQYSNQLDAKINKLLENLSLIASQEFTKLAQICGVKLVKLKKMVEILKELNPKPASVYYDHQLSYIKPDIFLKKAMNGELTLELNHDILPKIVTNYGYYAEIKHKMKNSDQQYLSEQLKDANILVRALEQRAKTILKVSKAIVEYQKEFFEKGVLALKPLTLKTIAESLNLHESTISRATAHKYIATPMGTFELKYFFSSYIEQKDNNKISSLAIKNLIKQLLEQESTTKIMSDQQIASSLKERNIKIARRTVAKYRESLNILSSSKRKFTKMVS